MAKYLVIWEVDMSRIPTDPKEQGAALKAMLDQDRQSIKDGIITDWGCFLGELRGYTIHDVSEEELEEYCLQFVPFATFKTYRVLSLDECAKHCAELAKS